jgi:GH15 family glucan-1,4-alpha-glucosidase
VRLEDYALIGDTQTAALVGRDGSIDWLCLPRFDSAACFAALLGEAGHGHWRLAPAGGGMASCRRYRPGSLVLESDVETGDGAVGVTDAMPVQGAAPDVVRVVEGLRGRVDMRMAVVIRFDYGSAVPWVQVLDGTLRAVAGPDSLYLRAPVELRGEGLTTVAEFTVEAGERVAFVLTWPPSHEPPPAAIAPYRAIDDTDSWWREWSVVPATGTTGSAGLATPPSRCTP